jgi:hypothetical protein
MVGLGFEGSNVMFLKPFSSETLLDVKTLEFPPKEYTAAREFSGGHEPADCH